MADNLRDRDWHSTLELTRYMRGFLQGRDVADRPRGIPQGQWSDARGICLLGLKNERLPIYHGMANPKGGAGRLEDTNGLRPRWVDGTRCGGANR